MSNISNSALFVNRDIYAALEKPVEGQAAGEKQNLELQEQFGGYKGRQLDNLKTIQLDNFRAMVNYLNPKNKGAVRFTSDLRLEKCNNKVDIGSLRKGLNSQTNKLMRQTFANALGPGLRYIADREQLASLMATVTGAKLKNGASALAGGWKFGEANTIRLSEGAQFSTERLERKQIRDAIEIYDRAFNTAEGRKAAINALLKRYDWNGVEDRDSFCLRKFGRPFDRVIDPRLCNMATEVDGSGEYADFSTDKAFIAQLEKLEQRLELAKREEKVWGKLSSLCENYNPNTQFHANEEMRGEFSALLWDSLLCRLPEGSVERRNLIANAGNFGGKDPMNIFMDEVFDTAIGDLMKKYGKDSASGPQFDQKVGMQIYVDLVQIASNYIQMVQVIEKNAKSYNDGQNQQVAQPKAQASESTEKEVGKRQLARKKDINFSAASVETVFSGNGLVLLSVKPMLNSKTLEELKSSHESFNQFISKKDVIYSELYTQFGVEIAKEQMRQLKGNLPGLGLEAQVLSMTDKFKESEELYKTIIRKPEDEDEFVKGKPEAKELQKAYASADLPVLDENFLFGMFDGERVKEHFKGVLDRQIRNMEVALTFENNQSDMGAENMMSIAMTEIINKVDNALGGKSALGRIARIFKSEAAKQEQDELTKNFRDAAIAGLLNRYFATKIQEASEGKSVSFLYGDVLPVMKYLEEIASKIETRIKPMRDKFDEAVRDARNVLRQDAKDRLSATELKAYEDEVTLRLHEAYNDKIRQFLMDLFSKIDIDEVRKENPDARDLGRKSSAKLTEFLTRQANVFTSEVAETMDATLKSALSKISTAFNAVMKSVQKQQADLVNLGIASFVAVNDNSASPTILKFGEGVKDIVLFPKTVDDQPNKNVKEMMQGRCSSIATRLVIDNYGKYEKAATEEEKENVLKEVKKEVGDKFEKTAKSVRTYAANVSAAILKGVKSLIEKKIPAEDIIKAKNDPTLRQKAVDTIAQKILSENLTSLEGCITDCVNGDFANILEKGGELKLPKFGPESEKRVFNDFAERMKGVNGDLSKKIELVIEELKEAGSEARAGLLPAEDFEVKKVLEGANLKFFESLSGEDFATKYPHLVPLQGTVAGGVNEFGNMLFFNHFNYLADNSNSALSNFEIGVMGKDGFKDELVKTYQQEIKGGRFTNFEQYLKDAEAFFADAKNSFNLPDDLLVDCKKFAFFGENGTAVRNVGTDFSVENMKTRYHQGVITTVKRYLTREQSKAGGVQEVLGRLFSYVQERVDGEYRNWSSVWDSEKMGLLRVTEKEVLRRLITKAAVEFTNQIWAVEQDDIEKEVPFEFDKFSFAEYSKGKASQLEKYTGEKLEKLADRVTKMLDGFDKFIDTVTWGLRQNVGSMSRLSETILKALIGQELKANPNELKEQIEKLEPGSRQRVEYYLGNKEGLTRMMNDNLLDSDTYYNAMAASVATYWNDCCKANVFSTFAQEAKIELPVNAEMKAVEIPEVKVKAEEPKNESEIKNPPNDNPKVNEKPGLLNRGSFGVDVNDEKMIRLRTLIRENVNADLTMDLANKAMDSQTLVEATKSLMNNKSFIRDTIGAVIGLSNATESTWKDIEAAVRTVFFDRVRAALEKSISSAMQNQDEVVSFDAVAKTMFANSDISTALAEVAKARWQRMSVEKWAALTSEIKKPIIQRLDEYLDVPSDRLGAFVNDEKGVELLCAHAQGTKDVMVGDILKSIPISEFLKDNDAMKNFLQSGKLPDGLSVDKIFDRWLTDALTDVRSHGTGSKGWEMREEVNQKAKTNKVVSGETLTDRLAGYKGYVLKSIDEIKTTRECWNEKFADQYANGECFKTLFQTGPFVIYDIPKSVLPFKRFASGKQNPVFVNSYEDFTKFGSYLDKHKKSLEQNSGLVKELFGHHWGDLAVLDFGKAGSDPMKALGGVLKEFKALFATVLRARAEVKQAPYFEAAKILQDKNAGEDWRTKRRQELNREYQGKGTKESELANLVNVQLDKEYAEMAMQMKSVDFGVNEQEATDLCKMLRDAVVSLVNVQTQKIDGVGEELAQGYLQGLYGKLGLGTAQNNNEWFAKDVVARCRELAKTIKTWTKSDGDRNKFYGFTTKLKILMGIVEGGAVDNLSGHFA